MITVSYLDKHNSFINSESLNPLIINNLYFIFKHAFCLFKDKVGRNDDDDCDYGWIKNQHEKFKSK